MKNEKDIISLLNLIGKGKQLTKTPTLNSSGTNDCQAGTWEAKEFSYRTEDIEKDIIKCINLWHICDINIHFVSVETTTQ